jgi:hypothetical protein
VMVHNLIGTIAQAREGRSAAVFPHRELREILSKNCCGLAPSPVTKIT